MRTLKRNLLVTSSAALALLVAGPARAQLDINPPLPNVLLLVDTSGSMEFNIDGTTTESGELTNGVTSACSPGVPSTPNRWGTLVNVMTGTIQNFSCQAENRSQSTFITQYSLGSPGTPPYDANYMYPYHRPLSGGCGPAPGVAPAQTSWWQWPAGAIAYKDQNGNTCSTWSQSADGLLDVFRDRIRFGLMTFDTLPDAGTGIATAADGIKGTWSYFPNWITGGTPATGMPAGCMTASTYEVGARNAAAPPWEGRLIPFGPYNDSIANTRTTNQHIQDALTAIRPFGATPIAGMLSDATWFIYNDQQEDKNATAEGAVSPYNAYGPSVDPYFNGGCRKTFIILLTDGEPNEDMMPSCAQSGGHCPFGDPTQQPYLDNPAAQLAYALASNSDPKLQVETFVVGFGLSNAKDTANNAVNCTTITQQQFTNNQTFADGKFCKNQTGALKACCTLGEIAYFGKVSGSGVPYFANNPQALKSALSTVLGQIAAGSTARTMPVFSTAQASGSSTEGQALASAYQFVTSFATAGPMWTGNLERKRYQCSPQLQAAVQPVTSNLGDDFAANLNAESPANPRYFWTVVANPGDNGQVFSTHTIRNAITTDDGLGLYKGTVTNAGPAPRSSFASSAIVTPAALGFPTTTPAVCTTTFNTTDNATCATDLIAWETGDPSQPNSRNPTSSNCVAGPCSELGAIYHSTPVVVGPPKDFLRDESYSLFATQKATRPTMLYTATTDGQLHAFEVTSNNAMDTFKVDSLANNELWSFFPPAVLPQILSTYNQQATLLDGQVVVKDVVYDRSPTNAIAGGGVGGATWNTVLVGGGGAFGAKFYYGLDVTDPRNPKFLWQISNGGYENDGQANDNDNHATLFGDIPPTPAIATINLRDTSGNVREVAVAILPGGSDTPVAGSCLRQQTNWPNVTFQTPGFALRSAVNCWATDNDLGGHSARSVTVVRLDTGQLLMNFRGALNDGPPNLPSAVVKIGTSQGAPLDSPMSGTPVPYPSDPGTVSDRVYLGDADGTLWRMDLSSPDPANWKIDLAWDAYSMPGDTANSGQPIQTPPIVSIDPIGNPVVLFSTGDQENLTSSTEMTRVWSILDKPTPGAFKTTENWVVPFTNGKRVTGPLALFNSVVYFSTYTPTNSTNPTCNDGFGSIWGVDYTQSVQQQTGPYPKAQLANNPNDLSQGYTWFQDQPPGVIVSGVGVTETPTCDDTTSYSDQYFGQASFSGVSAANAGTFQLVFNTGKGGTASDNSVTKTTTMTLPRPRETTRIDSWASIIE